MRKSTRTFIASLIIVLVGCNGNAKTLQERALSAFSRKEYKIALDIIDVAIDKDSLNSMSYLIRGEILQYLNRNKEAIDNYDKILAFESENTVALFQKGVVYYNVDNYDSAITSFNSAILTKGNDSVFIEYNSDLAVSERFSDVQMSDIRFERGRSYYQKENFVEALKDFKFCENSGTNLKDVFLYIGNIYLIYHKNTVGCAYLKKSLDLGNIEAKRFIVMYCE